MKNFFGLLILFAACMSCKPDPVETNIPQASSKLVISSQVMPEGVLGIVVSRSFSAKEQIKPGIDPDSTLQLPVELLVQDAEVVLTTPKGNIILEEVAPGIYVTTNWEPQYMATYTVRVHEKSSGLQVIATTPLLPPVKLDEAAIIRQDGRKAVHYAFTDDPSRENWYVVNFLARASKHDSTVKKWTLIISPGA